MKNSELEKIKLMAIVSNDCLKKSDAVVCLEGDGYTRIDQAVRIFKQGLAKKIVISGGIDNPPFSIVASKMAKKMAQAGVLKGKIIIEEKSQNTSEQGLEVMKLVQKNKWKRIILVASHFHQTRAFLTFLKAMEDAKMKIQIFNAPARELPWFNKISRKRLSRLQMLEDEFKKIDEYAKKFHLVSIKEAIKYQQWKEKQK